MVFLLKYKLKYKLKYMLYAGFFRMMAVGVFTLFLGANLYAGDVYSPAGFGKDGGLFQSRIKFPEWGDDINLMVHCDASVLKSGKLKDNYCFLKDEKYKPFEKSINRAARNLNISAAMVNGERESIWFQYFVVFYKKGNEEMIMVQPNHALEVNKYGREYSSPQRYKDNVKSFFTKCGRKTNIWVKAIIDEQGRAKNIEVIGGEGHRGCKKDIKNKFSLGYFIPARSKGKFVSARYIESFFKPEYK